MRTSSELFPRPANLSALALALLLGATGCGRNAVFGLGESEDAAVVADGAASGGDGAVADGSVLPDATLPPADAGLVDAYVPQDGGELSDADVPPPDGGARPDATTPDLDAGPGPVDADVPDDGGVVVRDGGDAPDAAPPVDAGNPADAGGPDDAGAPDSGPTPDAGTPGCVSDADCGGDTPVCNAASGQCVECLNDNQCSFGRTCDTQYGFVCRRGCFGTRCRGGDECDPATGLCYECLTDADCGGDELCHPSLRECVECVSNSDCALRPGQPICTPDLECRGCGSDADCPPGEECYGQQGGFCAPPTGRAMCTPCDDDAQCGGADDLCIGYFVGTGYLDRSCADDCSNSACPRGFECINVRGNRQVCRPRYDMRSPTCTAHRTRGAACAYDPNDLDPGCGVENLQDSRCIATSSGGTGQCLFWCDDNSDCPTGTSCTPVGNVDVCL